MGNCTDIFVPAGIARRAHAAGSNGFCTCLRTHCIHGLSSVAMGIVATDEPVGTAWAKANVPLENRVHIESTRIVNVREAKQHRIDSLRLLGKASKSLFFTNSFPNVFPDPIRPPGNVRSIELHRSWPRRFGR
jgi:hypothetical protein